MDENSPIEIQGHYQKRKQMQVNFCLQFYVFWFLYLNVLLFDLIALWSRNEDQFIILLREVETI